MYIYRDEYGMVNGKEIEDRKKWEPERSLEV